MKYYTSILGELFRNKTEHFLKNIQFLCEELNKGKKDNSKIESIVNKYYHQMGLAAPNYIYIDNIYELFQALIQTKNTSQGNLIFQNETMFETLHSIKSKVQNFQIVNKNIENKIFKAAKVLSPNLDIEECIQTIKKFSYYKKFDVLNKYFSYCKENSKHFVEHKKFDLADYSLHSYDNHLYILLIYVFQKMGLELNEEEQEYWQDCFDLHKMLLDVIAFEDVCIILDKQTSDKYPVLDSLFTYTENEVIEKINEIVQSHPFAINCFYYQEESELRFVVKNKLYCIQKVNLNGNERFCLYQEMRREKDNYIKHFKHKKNIYNSKKPHWTYLKLDFIIEVDGGDIKRLYWHLCDHLHLRFEKTANQIIFERTGKRYSYSKISDYMFNSKFAKDTILI